MSVLDRVLGRNSHHVSHKLGPSHRKDSETHSQYRARRKREQRLLKEYLKGDMVWCAKAFKSVQIGTAANGEPISTLQYDQQTSKGTYVKKKHGIIKSPRRKG